MMRFEPMPLPGVWLVEPECQVDERGLFARVFCVREFQARGLVTEYVQGSTSFTRERGTVRGLHYQRPPSCEVKLVRCTAGAVHDVIVDVRRDSPTYLQHVAVELTAQNRRALYVPEMCAHGYQTLADECEVSYQMSQFYAPTAAAGLRFDDPGLAIRWPLTARGLSAADRAWPLVGGMDAAGG
jgi:dTDP-4-dehydrorhamnose 3,5-epimerase